MTIKKKVELIVTITNMTKSDFEDVLFEARDKLGIRGGELIPGHICDFQSHLINILFNNNEEDL